MLKPLEEKYKLFVNAFFPLSQENKDILDLITKLKKDLKQVEKEDNISKFKELKKKYPDKYINNTLKFIKSNIIKNIYEWFKN